MIRTVPVDTSRLALLCAGPPEPVTQWVDDPATGRRKPSDQPERDQDTGLPLWRVHVLVPGGDNSRPELVAVQVPAQDLPVLAEFSPVTFERLEVRVAVGRDGRLAGYWGAAGVAPAAQHQGGHQGRGHKGQQEGEAA